MNVAWLHLVFFALGLLIGWCLAERPWAWKRDGWSRRPKMIPGHVVGDVWRKEEERKRERI